jgi:hypothetical protein
MLQFKGIANNREYKVNFLLNNEALLALIQKLNTRTC